MTDSHRMILPRHRYIKYILFAMLLISLCKNSSGQKGFPVSPANITYYDPLTVDPCYPRPTESSPFLSWDGQYLSQEWWEWVMKARNIPKKLKKPTNAKCQSLYTIKPDMRRYYWQVTCPYKVFWLSRFTWKNPYNPQYTETCYVLHPCLQQVRIVNCTTAFCMTRCRVPYPNVRNSVCLENYFVEYKKVYVFCTHTHKKVKGRWEEVNCKKFPHFCAKRVTLRVPQSCECWQCWDIENNRLLSFEKGFLRRG